MALIIPSGTFFSLILFPPIWLLRYKYTHPLIPPSTFFLPFSPFFQFLPILHLHEDTEKLRKSCAGTVRHLTKSVSGLWKNALRLRRLPIQVYWPSAKLFDLGDHLVPDTYHTPNSVSSVFFLRYLMCKRLKAVCTWLKENCTRWARNNISKVKFVTTVFLIFFHFFALSWKKRAWIFAQRLWNNKLK